MKQTYKCTCGDYHYLEFWFDEDTYCFSFIEEPRTLKHWIKRLFKKRSYINEVILNQKQLKQLLKEIQKSL